MKKKIWQYLKSKGFSNVAAAALMGNMEAESNCVSYRLQGDFTTGYVRSIEYTERVDAGTISRNEFLYTGPGGGGYGLMQWTYPARKAGLYDLAKEQCLSVGDVFLQVEWLTRELWQPEFKGVLEVLQNSVSLRECSDVLVKKFLRPADQSEGVCAQRAKLAREFYNDFADLEAEDIDGQEDCMNVPVKELNLLHRAMSVVVCLRELFTLMEGFDDE